MCGRRLSCGLGPKEGTLAGGPKALGFGIGFWISSLFYFFFLSYFELTQTKTT